MNFKLFQFDRTYKLENALVLSVVLFLFKLIFPYSNSVLWVIPNEALVILTFYFVSIYSLEFINTKKYTPLSIILNAGILNAVIFFVLSVLAPVLSGIFDGLTRENFMFSIGSTFYSFIFIAALAYIYSVFKTLFFLRQKKSPKFYFNTLAIFLLATSLSNNIALLKKDMDYIQPALMVVTILLISINSIRIPWIAFLTKKEKIYLLIISTVLSILFGVNIALASSSNVSNQLLLEFSPSLHQFTILLMIYGTIFFGIIFFTTLFHLPTASAFDRKAQEASSLINLSKLITQVFDFKELADTVTDITIQVCNSNSAWLVSETEGVLTVSAVKNIGYVEADKIVSKLSSNYDLRNIKNVKTVRLSNLRGEETADNNATIKCLAIAPLKVHNKIDGYLIAARKSEDQFDEDDQKSIGAFAEYAALAIENSRLLEESLEKERLEKELDVAREIQYKILPDKTPQIDCLDISAVFIPAFEVGGDYYDFFHLPDNKLGFVIADVSGKGITAAFIMAEIKGIFESLSKLIESPREVLIKANEILRFSLEKKSFITVIYGVFDLINSKMFFARAGHMPLLLSRDSKIVHYKPGGMGLGLDHTSNFVNTIEEVEIKLKENDILVLFTDGITESKNASLEDFGDERFEKIILTNGKVSLDELANQIMREVTTFSQGSPQHDDITLVIFKWKLKNKNSGEI
ncbi:MAG: SpoIIE family protein phosphatase [Ignavibacteriales bacterium]|nr:SpoIIE family protein phosphatase [Ignavibacteriales bacterium]